MGTIREARKRNIPVGEPVLTLEEAFSFKATKNEPPAENGRIVGYIGKAKIPVQRAASLQKRIDRHERWLRSE